MQGLIPVKNYTSAAEMRAGHAATRAKLLGKPTKIAPSVVSARKTATLSRSMPTIIFIEQHDAHVSGWSKFVARKAVEFEEKALASERLEGTIKSLRTHLSRQRNLIERLRNEIEAPKTKGKTRAEDVIKRMAKASGLSIDAILGAQRTTQIARVRHLTTYQVHVECPHLSIADIGRIIGGRDRTTVLNSIEQAKRIIVKD